MLPVEHNDPVNAKILAVSEDKIEGFVREPFEEIANRSGVAVEVVMARIAAMLRAGTIRRVRQTLLATNLAEGALVAWKVPEEKIDAAFDWMFQRDPGCFSAIRSRAMLCSARRTPSAPDPTTNFGRLSRYHRDSRSKRIANCWRKKSARNAFV